MNETVEKLEELFALPWHDEKTEINEEWLSVCNTLVSYDLKGPNKGTLCARPAVVNLTLVCPFCGPTRSGKCEDHFAKGIAGQLYCTECSQKAGTEIFKKPINCVWKSE